MSGRLLITGANGYLGAHCIARYARAGDTEVVAVWHSGRERLLADAPAHVRYVQCDLTHRPEVDALVRRWGVDKVVHAAALLPDTRADYLHRAIQANVVATANLVDAALHAELPTCGGGRSGCCWSSPLMSARANAPGSSFPTWAIAGSRPRRVT